MDTASLWEHITTQSKHYPELTDNIEVDVAIVGGGITGITAALQLIASGKKVALLESYRIGGGTTGFSTGNLYIPIQPYYQKVLSNFDVETVKIVANSRKVAIDYIESTAKTNNIQCNFTRKPMYFYANQKDEIDFLIKEVELLKKCSINIEYTENLPLSLQFKKAALMENQARFNPLQYVVSLAEYLSDNGCLILKILESWKLMKRIMFVFLKQVKLRSLPKKELYPPILLLGLIQYNSIPPPIVAMLLLFN